MKTFHRSYLGYTQYASGVIQYAYVTGGITFANIRSTD